MRKGSRVLVVAALVGGSVFVSAAPASATCRPEDKVPCETEFPDPRELGENCYTGFQHGLPFSLGVCDL